MLFHDRVVTSSVLGMRSWCEASRDSHRIMIFGITSVFRVSIYQLLHGMYLYIAVYELPFHPFGGGAHNPLDSLKYLSSNNSILSNIFIPGLPFPASTPSYTPSRHQTLHAPIILAITTSVPNRSPTTAISSARSTIPRSRNHSTTASPQNGFFSIPAGSLKTGIWRCARLDSRECISAS